MEISHKSVEEEIEEGKQRDDILSSVKGVGIAVLVLGILTFCIGILSVIIGYSHWRRSSDISYIGHGIWCSIFGIAAGITTIVASNNVTYCTVCWALIGSSLASVFYFILLVLEVLGMIVTAARWNFGLTALHGFEVLFGMAEWTLCIYNLVFFIRLLANYPYSGGRASCCPCMSVGNASDFGHVMYTSINPKKHGA